MSRVYKNEMQNKYRENCETLLKNAPPYMRDFYNYMARSHSDSTRNRYLSDVLAFIQYEHDVILECNDIAIPDMPVFIYDKLSVKDISNYRTFLSDVRMLTDNTIKRMMSAIAVFYRFLNFTGDAKTNPTTNLSKIKVSKHPIVALDAELSTRLLSGILSNSKMLALSESDKNAYTLELQKRVRAKRQELERSPLYQNNEEALQTELKRYEKAEAAKLDHSFEPMKVPVPISYETWFRREKMVLRNYAITALFLGSGLRVSELVGLDTYDIRWRDNGLSVIKKGGDEVMVYFNDDVATALRAYVQDTALPIELYMSEITQDEQLIAWCKEHQNDEQFAETLKKIFPDKDMEFYAEAVKVRSALHRPTRSEYLSPDDRTRFLEQQKQKAVFLSNQGKRMTVRMVEKMIKEMVRTYLPDYDDKNIFSPHKLRATCATRILTQTGDIEMAAAQLNHASIATTSAFYAELKKEKQKDTIRKLNMKDW